MNKKLMSTVTVAGLATLGGMADASADTKYTIENGDTLSHIALEYATTVSQIAAENNIENPDLIFAGDTLWINGVQVKPAVSTANVAPQAPVVAPEVVTDTPTTETVEVEKPAAKPVAPKVIEVEAPVAKPVAPKAVEAEKSAQPVVEEVIEVEAPVAKPVAPKAVEVEKPAQPVIEEVTEVEAPVAESVAPKAVEAEKPAQPVVEEVTEVEVPVAEAPIAEVVEEVEAPVETRPVAPKPLKQVQPQVQQQTAPVVPTTPAPVQPEVNVNLSVYERFLNAGGTDSLWNVIVMPESGGNPEIVSPSGYRGLGQTKESWGMGTVEEQTAGMLNYAEQRYGSVAGAVAFRLANGWW